MALTDYVKAGELIRKRNTLDCEVKALTERIKAALGMSLTSYSYSETDLFLEIQLAAYLAAFPESAPEPKTYFSEMKGKAQVYFTYPYRLAGEMKTGGAVWVNAQTPCVDLPAAPPAPVKTETTETAA